MDERRRGGIGKGYLLKWIGEEFERDTRKGEREQGDLDKNERSRSENSRSLVD